MTQQKLKDLKKRKVKTLIGEMECLQYIVRIEIESSHTYGWQVRFNKPFVFFSDKSYSKTTGKGVRLSYKEAVKYLESIYVNDYRKHTLKKEIRASKQDKTLPVGVSFNADYSRFQISFPVFGSKTLNKTLYVKKDLSNYKKKMKEAISLRKQAEKDYKIAKSASLSLD